MASLNATVAAEPDVPVISATREASSTRKPHHEDFKTYVCAGCGRNSRFTRHETLARFKPRWRARPP